MSNPEPGPKHLDVKKYPNRRYYDATHSRHMTLEEIRTLIRDGHDITVTDSKTGADITAQVLTQIILELETPKIDTFPVELLLRVIRSNDQMVRDFVEKYFSQAFRAYVDYQKQVEEKLRQMPGMPGFFPPFGGWAQTMANPFMTGSGPASSEGPKPPPTPPRDSAEEKSGLHDAVAELRQQIASLKEQLKTQSGSRRKRK